MEQRCPAQQLTCISWWVWQEIQALAAAGPHPGIARYHGAWLEQRSGGEHSVFIQMEMCGMTLGSRLAIQGHPFREAELLDVLAQACDPSPTCRHNMLLQVVAFPCCCTLHPSCARQRMKCRTSAWHCC